MSRIANPWIVSPEEFAAWVLEDHAEFAVIDKPAGLVCHPSKHGPWSSLAGAAREYFGLETAHMPFRLDRETSGVFVVAKDRATASMMQRAVERRRVEKAYLAILAGRLDRAVAVDQPLDRDRSARVRAKQCVVAQGLGHPARTMFEPLAIRDDRTLVRVKTETGRMHQIRVHAAWLGHPVLGDKLYGGDETLFLDFIAGGLSEALSARLAFPRHALHCASVVFDLPSGQLAFASPLPEDLAHCWSASRELPLPER